MESIPDFQTQLSPEEMHAALEEAGCFIARQTAMICPADKLFYETRDVTGTVTSIPLITASILSKKESEGLEALVLDVKFGRAAFMKKYEDARSLAEAMVHHFFQNSRIFSSIFEKQTCL